VVVVYSPGLKKSLVIGTGSFKKKTDYTKNTERMPLPQGKKDYVNLDCTGKKETKHAMTRRYLNETEDQVGVAVQR